MNTNPNGNPVLVVLPLSKDYKRVGEIYRKDSTGGMVARDDVGEQTGGMASYSPPSFFTETVDKRTYERILLPIQNGLLARGIDYCGVLYPALMIDDEDPYVIEINTRPGSPELEVVWPRVENDIVEVMVGVMDGTLKQEDLRFIDNFTLGVVLASGPIDGHPGYPASGYKTGYKIEGLDEVDDDVTVFLGGTQSPDKGKTILTSGGRIAIVVASGKTPEEAKKKVLANAERIRYDNKYYRDDVAYEEGV